jgi:hypothetical protein
MTPGQSSIARALDAMEEERGNLAARLAKVEALIAQMRDAFHLPSAPASRAATKAPRAPKTRASSDAPVYESKYGAAIHSALQKGPLSPADLSMAVGVQVDALNYHVRKRAGHHGHDVEPSDRPGARAEGGALTKPWTTRRQIPGCSRASSAARRRRRSNTRPCGTAAKA